MQTVLLKVTQVQLHDVYPHLMQLSQFRSKRRVVILCAENAEDFVSLIHNIEFDTCTLYTTLKAFLLFFRKKERQQLWREQMSSGETHYMH